MNREKENSLYDEKKIGELDRFLLCFRVGIFSFFILFAGGTWSLEKLKIFNFINPASGYFIDFFFLGFLTYLFLAFIIDQYYERLLLSSAVKLCVLAIKTGGDSERLLSKETEPLKNKIGKIISSAKIYFFPFLYIFLFWLTVFIHLLFLFESKTLFWVYSFSALYLCYFIALLFISRLAFVLIKTLKFYHGIFLSSVLFGSNTIEKRLKEVSGEIFSKEMDGRTENTILLIPILEGGRFFASRFKKAFQEISPLITIEECPITIKRTAGETLAEPRIVDFRHKKELFKDRFVIIIDDLTDEGQTLKLACETISKLKPERLITLVLIVKRSSKITELVPDYFCFHLEYDGFEADKKWLFGYGMDLRGEFRDLNLIAEYKLP